MKTIQLHNYQHVLGTLDNTAHLLLGNGFSIACDPIFKYNNIYQFAKDHGLSPRVQAMFAHFGTTNFELIARALSDSAYVGNLYGFLTQPSELEIEKDIQEIKNALVSAIAKTHLATPNQMDADKRASCVSFLKPYTNVFTTNYDLLLYWSTMQGISDKQLQFQDGFRASVDEPNEEYVVFSKRLGDRKGIFYLHGALHLSDVDGEVRKHCWNRSGVTITEHVITSLQADTYPLFVAEGESIRKLEHIQRSGYLTYCYLKLQGIQRPIVVYGSSLGDSDDHITNAIGDSDCPVVWLGVHGGIDSTSASHAELVAAKLEARRQKANPSKPLEVCFYDVSTVQVWNSETIMPAVKKQPIAAFFSQRAQPSTNSRGA